MASTSVTRPLADRLRVLANSEDARSDLSPRDLPLFPLSPVVAGHLADLLDAIDVLCACPTTNRDQLHTAVAVVIGTRVVMRLAEERHRDDIQRALDQQLARINSTADAQRGYVQTTIEGATTA